MIIKRLFGRSFDQIRPFKIVKKFTSNSDASILISMGNTVVLCNANILDSVPDFMKGTNSPWITAEYSMLPSSTKVRMTREAVVGKQSGRTHEIQRLIGRSLRAAFDMKYSGEFTIKVDCDVLQADGGTRCASITGAYLAIVDILPVLYKKYSIRYDKKFEKIAAISVGLINNDILLDMDYKEDSNCDVDMNVVMDANGNFIEIQVTGEKIKFNKEKFDLMLSAAGHGILKLISYY
ncbi:ribonuclease PH [Candidatus Kinetoplastidibacterium crithidiae]|uniref:Ribonuclease PH n=1 Tax=Candidatus Kinetoplastidibacterium crithidiae TCC036E TaxID=1208918 RepID=M1LU17_9PROT|nr:ribonuclease PH [Candidatus Kinetoplastibacterium crithidii]AFZ82748.1 ribonuclease PH [Candidatus Kinetoplastibacterium crithidii (ex Angomonas deanei ATCC 30255)]AGF47601.1 ribonuclease PH [Candidatus Kinetoplastibacterium crithidii TCC036E]